MKFNVTYSINLLNTSKQNMDRNFIDLSKAFDMIDHVTLFKNFSIMVLGNRVE